MKPAIRRELELLFYDLERKCEGLGWGHWSDLLRTIEEQERGHRRMGARFTRGQAKYSCPIRVAVQYFACKTILEPIELPKDWSGVAGYRRDYILGQGIRARAGDLSALEQRWEDLALDYAKDIAA